MAGFKPIPFLLLSIILSFRLVAQPENEIDWLYEIDLLGKELAQRHSNLFFQTDSSTFYSELDQIAIDTGEISLFDKSIRLQQVVAKLGDAHTRINYHFNISPNTILPLEFYWFEDGIYVIKSRVEYQELLGKRLVAINEFPLKRIIDSLTTLIVVENPSLIKSQLPRMLTWKPLLDYFGFSGKNGLLLAYETNDGAIGNLVVKLHNEEGEEMSIPTGNLPLGWENQNTFFRDRFFPNDRIYYIQYNKCWSREAEEDYGTGASALFMPSFKEFEKKVFRTIKKQNIDKLVFDMRYNGGGHPEQGTKFIKKLSKTRFNGLGEFYVLIGRQTFSAAIVNTVDFMKHTDALLIGEGTSGKPNHYGEIKRFVLPESKLVVNYSTHYFQLLDEDIVSITPDIETPITISQFMQGIDPAIEVIRNQQ